MSDERKPGRRRPSFAGMFSGPPGLAANAKDIVRGQGEFSEAAIRADERRRVLDELEAVARAVNYAHVRADLTAIIEAMRGTDD